MKFLTWFLIMAKRQFKNPLLLLLLFAIPATAVTANLMSSNEETFYEAGLYLQGDSELTRELAKALTGLDKSIHFSIYRDMDTMVKEVKNSHLVCGYLLPDNLDEKASLQTGSAPIKVIMQASAAIQPAVNEIVYSQLLKLQGRTIISDYVDSTGLFSVSDPAVMEELLRYYDAYTISSSTFHIDYKTAGPGAVTDVSPANTRASFPLRGICSILIMLSGLLGSVLWQIDREKGIFQVFQSGKKYLTGFLYLFIPVFCFSISSLIALACSREWQGFLQEFFVLLVYMAGVMLFCSLFMIATKKSSLSTAFIPVYLTGCLVLCPVFFHLSLYLPVGRILEKLFLPYYYLQYFL